jgi:O-methyltransferase domain/Dimerisation domain
MIDAPTPEDLRELVGLIKGYRISQAIYVVAELGIADLLKHSGKTSADELAAETRSHPESLYRVLRLLAGVGLVVENAPRRFELTRLGAGLASDVPGSPASLARLLLRRFKWEPWGDLLDNVRTGQSAFQQVHGAGVFEYLQEHPDEGRLFDAAMTENTARDGKDIAACYDFSNMRVVADIGGGEGLLLASILRRHPSLQGVLVDLPEVIARGNSVLEACGVAERCNMVCGSFFDALPPHADAYLLRHIVHDWNDIDAQRILANCRSAAGTDGKILVVERLVGTDHRAGSDLLANDLEMMVNIGGKERTEPEFRELFAQAGLQVQRIIGPFGAADHVILEGVAK